MPWQVSLFLFLSLFLSPTRTHHHDSNLCVLVPLPMHTYTCSTLTTVAAQERASDLARDAEAVLELQRRIAEEEAAAAHRRALPSFSDLIGERTDWNQERVHDAWV